MSALKAAFGIAVLAAVLIFCVVMVGSAWMDGSVLSISRRQGWITHQSQPGWYVASTTAYALVIALAVAALIAVARSRQSDRDFIRRGKTAPHIDGAIRQSPEER